MSRDPDQSGDRTRPAGVRQRLTYGAYLRLPELLSCQSPRSSAHDEMLFVIVHQTSELWIKLVLHELDAARTRVAADDIGQALKILARVNRIFAQLIQSWDVLGTLTPPDYARMRDALGTSSGFQSGQYRQLEFMLGNRSPLMLASFVDEPDTVAELTAELAKRGIYDEVMRLLARQGLPVPIEILDRDARASWVRSDGVAICWKVVYDEPERHWDLYNLAEKLVDLNGRFQLWRFRHLKTVERIIGARPGTGGTVGLGYLARTVDQSPFPELLEMRSL